jgi:MFS family permease
VGLLGSLLAGLTTAPMFSCQYALVGRTVTRGSETEAFAWVAGALISGIAAGSAAGGAVIGPTGVSGPFELACLAMGVAALFAFRAQVGGPETPRLPPEPQLGSLEPAASRSSTPASSS